MKFEVVGHRVLVKPKPLEKVSEGGIVIARPGDLEKREEAATQIGTIVGIGPNAWKAFDDGQPWAKLGDVIYYARYAGKMIVDEETKEKYFVINDEDVQAIVKE